MHKPIIPFQDLKFLLIFIVFQLHLFFRDSYKNVEGVILRATFKQYVPAHLMLYKQVRKQPEDLADNCFQRCQNIVVNWNF